MTAAAMLQAGGDGQDGITEYRVVVREGCTLIFGSVPVDHLVHLTKLADKKAVMHTTLAQYAGAMMAFGLPEHCDALAEKLRADKLRSNPIVDNLQRWLMVGERGESSNAIVAHLRGLPGLRKTAHPHDPDDLKRCLKLLEEVPELKADFPKMRFVSPTWGALVEHWTELTALFFEEGGENWRTGPWSAPRTFVRMQQLIEGARS